MLRLPPLSPSRAAGRMKRSIFIFETPPGSRRPTRATARHASSPVARLRLQAGEEAVRHRLRDAARQPAADAGKWPTSAAPPNPAQGSTKGRGGEQLRRWSYEDGKLGRKRPRLREPAAPSRRRSGVDLHLRGPAWGSGGGRAVSKTIRGGLASSEDPDAGTWAPGPSRRRSGVDLHLRGKMSL